MTAALCIDTTHRRVRRYEARRLGGRMCVTDEVRILYPQCHTIVEQLNDLLAGREIQYAPDLPQDHIPEGAT